MKEDIATFVAFKCSPIRIMGMIYEDIYEEEKEDADIRAILDARRQTYAYVDSPQMRHIVDDKDMDLEQALDEVITLIRDKATDVVIVDECHLMFINTNHSETLSEKEYKGYRNILRTKINELNDALDNTKVIFKTSKQEYQWYIEPYVTAPMERRITKVTI